MTFDEAEDLVNRFYNAVREQAVADWATAYGNSEPDRQATERVFEIRAELLDRLSNQAVK